MSIIFDFNLIDSLIASSPIISITIVIILLVNIFLAIGIVFLERRDAQSIWAWLFVLFFLPIIGAVLYMIFGGTLRREKKSRVDKALGFSIEERVKQQLRDIEAGDFKFTDSVSEKHAHQIQMLFYNSQSFITHNNSITTFTDMNEKFDHMIKDIENAKDHINFQYFAFSLDQIGTQVYQALLKKQREGVQVHILYDDIGSRSLSPRRFKELRAAGGFVEAFFPSKLSLINPRINYRNHRKIVVIDGKIGYIGGSNCEDKYLGRDEKMGAWRDTHLRIEGEAVKSLQLLFLMDWNSQSKHNEIHDEKRYFPEYHYSGDITMQVSSSGPDESYHEIKYGYVKMIHNARESIYIQSPYFVPEQAVMEALRSAILGGVKVKIMIPSFPDHPFIYWGSYSNVGELVNMGAEVYTYQPGFLHSKVIIIDDEVLSVGTTNIDNRSFILNFEVNTFIYSTEEATKHRKIFEKDIENCELLTIDKYNERSLFIKIKEGLANLISPLL